jgi:hypothetical protein
MRKILVVLSLLFTVSCASIGVKDPALELKIAPQPVERGKPAMAQINAPMDAERVVGTVLTMGSPQLLFNKDAEKDIWYFYGKIPFSPWVKPGTYTVRVVVHFAKGQPHYTEMKVSLK